jgi:FkbM family methyltransferase
MDEWVIRQIQGISRVIQPDWHYADIGACRGELLHYFQQVMSYGYAFEPDNENHDYLRSVIRATDGWSFPRVELIKSAVSDVDGTVKFYNAASHLGSLLNHDMSYNPYTSYVEVPCLKLDSFFADKQVDFIKVDIEGAEWTLFEGARKLLKERNIVWQVEFHLDEDWHKRSILAEYGYSIYDLQLNKLSDDAVRPYQAILLKGTL